MYHTTKTYWGSGGIVTPILNLGTRREWSVSGSGRFTPGTQWTGGWVGPGTSLDATAKRNKSHHYTA